MTTISKISFLTILFLTNITAVFGQTFNLSGTWRTDFGGTYTIRQNGEKICWYYSDLPRVHNVFCGVIAGNTISGNWLDPPGGQLEQAGQLALRIESNDRMVKISSTGDYGGSTWTRGTPAPSAQAPSAQPGWERVGIGDCSGVDVGSSQGFTPDNTKASAAPTAICWDGKTYNNRFANSGTAWCTYKSVPAGQCSGGSNPGVIYRAIAK